MVQCSSATAGEVAARGTQVGVEYRIAAKDVVCENVCQSILTLHLLISLDDANLR